MRLTSAFERLFRLLVRKRRTYDAAPREPDRVEELADARFDLDATRSPLPRSERGSSTPPVRTRTSPRDR